MLYYLCFVYTLWFSFLCIIRVCGLVITVKLYTSNLVISYANHGDISIILYGISECNLVLAALPPTQAT